MVLTEFKTRKSNYEPDFETLSLIKGLDAELKHLRQQCSVRKPLVNSNIIAGSMAGMQSSHSHKQSIHNAQQSAVSRPLSNTLPIQPISSNHLRQLHSMYRMRVVDAYLNRRIFTVNGHYRTVRRALLNRGWLEKLPSPRYAKLQAMTEEALLQRARRGNEYETAVISKMINPFPAFFIWQAKSQRHLYPEAFPYRNRIRRSPLLDFSTKVGLVGCAEQETWHCEKGVCRMNYPRFYRLGGGRNEDRNVFIEDYHNTQARSLLYWIKEHRPHELISPEKGKIMGTTIDFALKKVQKQLRHLEHGTLDDDKIITPTEIVENQDFMSQSLQVLKKGAKFKMSEQTMTEYVHLAEMFLNQIEKLRPDFRWDGNRNLWILKPGYQSRGIGIVIRSSLEGILAWTTNNPSKKYVVQKYIERPMLVYRTKFDIRQYMLLTIGEDKVTIWTYRNCYLRFSSQEFTMDDLRESIHLTNNSVQKRYKNETTRDGRLPRNNMWSLDRFKCHLKHIGAPENTWSKIYKGIKQNLVAVVRASLDETEFVKNAFELHGCDFMLDEQYNPILIEINSTPDLTASTEVTARICPTVIKDCIRVVVDLPKNPAASTGLFERAFSMSYDAITKQHKSFKQLKITGNRLKLHDMTKPTTKGGARVIRKILGNSICNKLGRMKSKAKKMKKSTQKSMSSLRPASKSSSTSMVMVVKANEKAVLNSQIRENLALQYSVPR